MRHNASARAPRNLVLRRHSQSEHQPLRGRECVPLALPGVRSMVSVRSDQFPSETEKINKRCELCSKLTGTPHHHHTLRNEPPYNEREKGSGVRMSSRKRDHWLQRARGDGLVTASTSRQSELELVPDLGSCRSGCDRPVVDHDASRFSALGDCMPRAALGADAPCCPVKAAEGR